MDSVFSTCFDFLKTEDAKRHVKDSIITPMGQIIYQDIYFYLWLICFYHIFLILLVLISVFLLFKQHSLLRYYISANLHNF
jgi:hypothetical protein